MFSLSRGFHTSPEKGMCLMELVAYLAGEEHTDIPACSSPLLTYMAQYVNDTVSNENRQRLIPLAWELMGTRCDACERMRARESWHYAVGKYGIKDPTYADNDGYIGVCLMDRLYYTYKGDVPFIDIAIDVMRHTIATCPHREEWQDGVSCKTPENIQITHVTSNSAAIQWEPNLDAVV